MGITIISSPHMTLFIQYKFILPEVAKILVHKNIISITWACSLGISFKTLINLSNQYAYSNQSTIIHQIV